MFFHRTTSATSSQALSRRILAGIHRLYALLAAGFLVATLWKVAQWLWNRYSYLDVVWGFAGVSVVYVVLLVLAGLLRWALRVVGAARESSRRRREAGRSLRKRFLRGIAWVAHLPVRGILGVLRGGMFASVWTLRGVWAGVRYTGDALVWPVHAGAGLVTQWTKAAQRRRTLRAQEHERRLALAAIEAQAQRERQEQARVAQAVALAAAQAQAQKEKEARAQAHAAQAQQRAVERARVQAEKQAKRQARRASFQRTISVFFAAISTAGRAFIATAAGGTQSLVRGSVRAGRSLARALVATVRATPIWSPWALVVGLIITVGAYDLYVLKLLSLGILQGSVGVTAILGILTIVTLPAGLPRWSWNSWRAVGGALLVAALVGAWYFGAQRSFLSDRSHHFNTLTGWSVLLVGLAVYAALLTDVMPVVLRKFRRTVMASWSALTRNRFSRERVHLSPRVRRQRLLSTRGWIYVWIVGYAALASVVVGFFVFHQPAAEAAPRTSSLPSTGAAAVITPTIIPVQTSPAITPVETPTAPELTVITRYLGCDPTGAICDHGPEVETLQHILKDAGTYTGPIDGAYSKDVGTALDKLLLAQMSGRAWDKHRFHGLLAKDQYLAMVKLYPNLFKSTAEVPRR